MKPAKAREAAEFDKILEALKRVPRPRLRLVREVVQALAQPIAESTPKAKPVRKQKKSLLDTPFCGMWADRTDITDSQAFARTLRRQLETRSDRREHLR